MTADITTDAIKAEIMQVLMPEFWEQLTEQEMKLIADQSARRITALLVNAP